MKKIWISNCFSFFFFIKSPPEIQAPLWQGGMHNWSGIVRHKNCGCDRWNRTVITIILNILCNALKIISTEIVSKIQSEYTNNELTSYNLRLAILKPLVRVSFSINLEPISNCPSSTIDEEVPDTQHTSYLPTWKFLRQFLTPSHQSCCSISARFSSLKKDASRNMKRCTTYFLCQNYTNQNTVVLYIAHSTVNASYSTSTFLVKR